MTARQVVERTEVRTLEVLAEATRIAEDAGYPFIAIGGLSSAYWGKPRGIRDIDLFLGQHDADRLLDDLDAAGFSTEKPEPDWLYKAFKTDVMIDLIFRVGKKIELDEEMVARATRERFGEASLPLAAPEDVVVMLAVTDKEDTVYWHNALYVVARSDIDWAYLARRADAALERTLSLLIYARSEGIAVPDDVVDDLYERFRRR